MICGKFESEIFGPGELLLNKLEPFGFAKEGGIYIYRAPLSVAGFTAEIIVKDDNLYGKVIEDDLGEEYGTFRSDIGTGFAYKVGEAYKRVLEDVAAHCYSYNKRLSKQSNRVISHIETIYHVKAEYPWNDDSCIFRHEDNRKWFALIMSIEESKLGRPGSKDVDILNLKADPYDISSLTGIPGIYLAYHMNKKHWITVVLNDEVGDDIVFHLIERSHSYTAKPKK